MLKHGILGLLSYQDMTGYEVAGVFRLSLSYFWRAQTSQVYRELNGLEDRGWVSSLHVPQTGKPDRRLYSVTAEGRSELARWLGDASVPLTSNEPLLMKAFFMGLASREEQLEFFRGVERDAIARLQELEEEKTEIPAEPVKDSWFWMKTVEYGEHELSWKKEWARRCLAHLHEAVEKESER